MGAARPDKKQNVTRFVRPFRVAQMTTNNKKYPHGYCVVDANGDKLVAHSGLFGWGWCSSRAAALMHSRVSEDDVIN